MYYIHLLFISESSLSFSMKSTQGLLEEEGDTVRRKNSRLKLKTALL
jgi:hypothetical protein